MRSRTHSQDSPSSRSQFHPTAKWRSSHGMGKGLASHFVLTFKKKNQQGKAGFRRGSEQVCPHTKFHASALAAATQSCICCPPASPQSHLMGSTLLARAEHVLKISLKANSNSTGQINHTTLKNNVDGVPAHTHGVPRRR